MKKLLVFLFELVKIVILTAIIVVPIRYLIFQPFFVRGDSMAPNFAEGDYLLIDELSYRLREPKRGEVIVFRAPDNNSARYIKRIIGLPQETVEVREGRITITQGENSFLLDESSYFPESVFTSGNLSVVLDGEEYFVLGDNRQFSSDSRRWGVLSRKNIVGRAFWRPWPIDRLAKIENPNY